MKERIQKVIASQGEYSRRQVETLIDERKVKVNGVVLTEKGMKVDPSSDRIQIAGKAFRYRHDEETVVVLLNKPRRVMVTRSDEQDRKTIYELLPKKFQHLKPAGRLDYNSQGALVVTNDGELINELTHPRHNVPKTYEVKLSSHPEEKQLERLKRGIVLDGVRTLPPQIKILEKNQTSTVIQMILKEGKNRQIRRMCEAVGLTVKELKRVGIGKVTLKNTRSGRFRLLTPREIKGLKA